MTPIAEFLMTVKKRAFISFDYDHDESLKVLLIGQSKHPDTPFELADWSIKEPVTTGNWKDHARRRIAAVDVAIVICGRSTHTAAGVSAEVQITRELNKPYFLLAGYSEGQNTRPLAARSTDKLYRWTWENLKALVSGAR